MCLHGFLLLWSYSSASGMHVFSCVLLYEWCEDVDFEATLNHGKITSNTSAPMVSVHGMLRDTMV